MSSSNDMVPATVQSKDKVPTSNGMVGDGVSSGGSSMNSEEELTNVTMNGDMNGGTNENLLYTIPPATTPQGIAMFPTFDASAWGAYADPSFMVGFPGMLAAAQNQFYFPAAATAAGTDMSIWSNQDILMNQPFLMNPLTVDQQQLPGTEVSLEGSVPVPAADPIMGLNQNFTGMALNGGIIQPVVPTVAATPNLVESNVTNVVSNQGLNSAPQPEKPKSWAAIASQPAKPRPPPPKIQPPQQPEPVNNENVSSKKTQPSGVRGSNPPGGKAQPSASSGTGPSGGTSGTGKGRARRTQESQTSSSTQQQPGGLTRSSVSKNSQSEVVVRLKSENKYNPSEMTLNMTTSRFFVIKSYAEDDIHRSIKYSIWTSTEHGNRRLDQAHREQQKTNSPIYLLFSVNGSGHFCGVAEMASGVDFGTVTGVWAQDKWKGRFDVKWIYVKDVPNNQLRHIRLENNENKPVTNSRDTQEVPLPKAKQVMKIVHNYQHTTSIFDDFDHYEKKQEEEKKKS